MLKTRPAKEVVVRLSNKVGALDEATKTLAEERSLVVFATSRNDRAMVLLNAST